MELYKDLYEIAKSDLISSKVLYEKKCYPQAIFYLQQSLEKATKAVTLKFDMIKEDSLKKYSHIPLKIFKNIYQNSAKDILEAFNEEALSEEGLNQDEFKPYIDKWKNAIDLFYRMLDKMYGEQKEFVNIDENKFKEIMGGIEEIENIFLNKKNYNKINKINSFNEATTSSGNIKHKKMYRYLWLFSFVQSLLFFLSYLLSSYHSSYTRYPVENYTPMNLYNENHVLVKYYSKLHSKLKICFNILDNFIYPNKLEDSFKIYDLVGDEYR